MNSIQPHQKQSMHGSNKNKLTTEILVKLNICYKGRQKVMQIDINVTQEGRKMFRQTCAFGFYFSSSVSRTPINGTQTPQYI